MRDLVRANGGQLRVMTFPFLHTLGADYPFRSVHLQIDEAWRELGVAHLDLLRVFQGSKPEQLTVNPHDAHPNENAHRLAAEALEQWLPEK
jgi:lysophospholipase L1-like esterase